MTNMVDSKRCETLVITSAVYPPAGVPVLTISDPGERRLQTFCALIRWIMDTPIQNIILCDGTAEPDEFAGLNSFAQRHGKQIEVLTFPADLERTVRQGKGYGEGQIMRHVMEHSSLLPSDPAFYKITGRLFVENFDHLHRAHAHDDLVFGLPGKVKPWKRSVLKFAVRIPPLLRRFESGWRGWGNGMFETNFYKCTKKFYVSQLIDRYELVDDRNEYFLEHALFLPLIRNGCKALALWPLYVGYSGSLGFLHKGKDYSQEVKSQARRLMEGEGEPSPVT